MNKPAIFAGAYCDMKFIRSRSVAQVIVEIPIERSADFIAAFGAPSPGAEVPVALARIDPNAEKAAPEPRKPSGEAEPRRKFASLSLAQQAGMRCADKDFQRFLAERNGASDMVATDAESTAQTVREICQVGSRSDIRAENVSGAIWQNLEADFQEWKHAVSYEEISR